MTMKRGYPKPQAATRRTRLFLLLVASLVAWMLARTGGAEPLLNLAGSLAGSDRCPHLADMLLEHWRNRTQLQSKRLERVAPISTAEVLRQLGLVVRDDYCYFKMRFNGTAVELADTFIDHCEGTSVQVLPRAHVYAQLFNRLLQQRTARQRLTPFEFYIDLNSGTRNNVELFRRLRVPILSFLRNPHDRYTVPLPDFHLTMGVYNSSLDYNNTDFGHLQGFAKDVSPTYKVDWAVPWSQKVPKLVYRGSCFPTLLSDAWSPSTRLNIRAELCSTYGGSTEYDIGLRTGAACLQPNKSETPMCAGCAPCFAKPEMSWPEQLMHKYQVVVDGIAGSSEGMAMKLLSNSAVIRLRPNGWDAPLFQFAYEPLLEAYKHFMPADIAGLPTAIAWCEWNPGKCKKMASAGRSFMRCFLRKEVLDDYIFGVFMYMHDSLDNAQQTSAEWNYALNI